MGRSHAVTGAALGAVTSPLAHAAALDPPVWFAAVLAASLAPDVDHPGATLARMWGPVSGTLAAVVSPLVGGHRGATHHVFAFAGFALLVVVASLHPVTAALVFAYGTGAAVAASEAVTRWDWPWPANLAVSATVGWLVYVNGWPLLPVALPVALGVVVHIAGDTIPVQSARERLVVAGSYVVAAAWVCWPIIFPRLQGVVA